MKNKVVSIDIPSIPLTAKGVGALIGSMVPQSIVRRIPLGVILLIPEFLESLPDKAEQMNCLTEIIKELKTASISDLALVVTKIVTTIGSNIDIQLISEAVAKGIFSDILGFLGGRYFDLNNSPILPNNVGWPIINAKQKMKDLVAVTDLIYPTDCINTWLYGPLPPLA